MNLFIIDNYLMFLYLYDQFQLHQYSKSFHFKYYFNLNYNIFIILYYFFKIWIFLDLNIINFRTHLCMLKFDFVLFLNLKNLKTVERDLFCECFFINEISFNHIDLYENFIFVKPISHSCLVLVIQMHWIFEILYFNP
jgi:hypothetical protein